MRRAAILLLLTSAAAVAQSPGDQQIPPVTYPELPSHAATLDELVPQGWKLEVKADGDLNRDRLPDAALVLHMDDSRNLVATDWDPAQKYDSNPRMIVVAFARNGGGYDLAVADHQLIPRLENQNQDEPFDEVAIVNGTLRVKMHLFMSAGGWQMGGTAYTFRWQEDGFKLIGFDRDSVMRNSGETEEISINYLTGRKLVESGNIGSDEESRKTLTLAKKPLIDLSEIGDGLMFNPDEH